MAHEDLVQPRLEQLEAVDDRTARDAAPEDRLVVGTLVEHEVRAVRSGLAAHHLGPVEPLVRSLEGHRDHPLPLAPLQLAQVPVEHAPGARDQAHALAQPLRLLHQMGREQHGGPAAVELEDDLLEHVLIERVETAERLVEDEQLRLVQNGRHELDLLLHPLGEVLDLAFAPGREPQPVEPLERALPPEGPRDTADLREEHEQLEHPHLAIDTALLREIAHPAARLVDGVAPEQLNPPLVGDQDAHHHADRGGLPRSVRAEQPVDAPRRNLEIETVHGGVCAEALGYAGKPHHMVGHPTPGRA